MKNPIPWPKWLVLFWATGQMCMPAKTIAQANSPACTLSPHQISTQSSNWICADGQADILKFSLNVVPEASYHFLILDSANRVAAFLQSDHIDLDGFAPQNYRVIGVAHQGPFTVDLGSLYDSLAFPTCHLLSSNELLLQVRKSLLLTPSAISDYHGYPISGAGQNDGIVQVQVQGGSGNYAYQWFGVNMQQDSLAFGLGAGTYSVEVSDLKSGCKSSSQITLQAPAPLQADLKLLSDYSGWPISCSDAQDGQLQAVGQGGVAPYQYQWLHDPQLGQAAVTQLGAGTYKVLLTDANGFQAQAQLSLNAPPPLLITAAYPDLLCADATDGEIQVYASGGIAPYQYTWTSGDPTPSLSGLSAGSYACMIEDAHGCRDTIAVSLIEAAPLSVTVALEAPTCPERADGSLLISPEGGLAPYQIQWHHGPMEAYLPDLPSGDYALTLTDVGGCQDSFYFVISDPVPMQASFMSSPDDGSRSGRAAISVTGGKAPYAYRWPDQDWQAEAESPGLTAGQHVVTVRDAQACEAEFDFVIAPSDRPECLKTNLGFSPNGDGINDTWELPCLKLFPEHELSLYNRWGQELFSLSHYDQSWDGRIGSTVLPEDTYYYRVKVRVKGRWQYFKGTLSIIK